VLTAAQLADMRAMASEALPDTCSILTPTRTPDGMGSESSSWAVSASAVPCRMAPSGLGSNVELERAARVTAVERWTLTLAWDQELTKLDRISYDGKTFEVEDIAADMSYQIHKRAQLALLT